MFSDNNSNKKIIILQDPRNRNDIILKSRVSPKFECNTNFIITSLCEGEYDEHHKNNSVQDIRGNRINIL